MALTNNFDFYYQIEVMVGSTGEIANLSLDMSSSDVWITSTLCGNCNTSAYNPTASTTSAELSESEQSFEIPRLNLIGQPYEDTICLQ